MKGNKWADHYTKRAKNEGWLARSAYKLKEMDEKYHLIPRGGKLLDLGCYPGSWTQYALRKVGPKGEVAGIDFTPPKGIRDQNFLYIEADALTLDIQALARQIGPRNLVMSDMAPMTTGVKSTDAARSINLAERSLEIALALLCKKGHFVSKAFEGEDIKPLRLETAKFFNEVRVYRPKATRKKSREIYILGLGLKT